MENDSATLQGVEGTAAPESSEADDIHRRMAEIVAEQEGQQATSEDAREGQSEADAKPEPDQPKSVKVKVNGEEREVPLDEVLSRYQKAEAAEKRFEEAARLRKEADELKTTIPQERQQLKQALDHFITQARAFMPAPPDQALLDSDPVAYLKAQADYSNRIQQLRQAEAAQAHLTQQRLGEEERALLSKIPEWRDPERASREKTALRDGLHAMGFSDAFVTSMSDHRDVLAARQMVELKKQADAYQQILSKAKELKPAKSAPKVERPGVAGTSLDGRTAAMQRLAKTGTVEAAAEVFKGLL